MAQVLRAPKYSFQPIDGNNAGMGSTQAIRHQFPDHPAPPPPSFQVYISLRRPLSDMVSAGFLAKGMASVASAQRETRDAFR